MTAAAHYCQGCQGVTCTPGFCPRCTALTAPTSRRGAVRAAFGLLLMLGAAGTLDTQPLAQAPQAAAPLLLGLLLTAWGGARLTYGPNLPRLQAAMKALSNTQAQALTQGDAL